MARATCFFAVIFLMLAPTRSTVIAMEFKEIKIYLAPPKNTEYVEIQGIDCEQSIDGVQESTPYVIYLLGLCLQKKALELGGNGIIIKGYRDILEVSEKYANDNFDPFKKYFGLHSRLLMEATVIKAQNKRSVQHVSDPSKLHQSEDSKLDGP